MRRMSRGFTIIELLVVVSVIGILSTISFTGFNRYQVDTRDSARQSQATLITEALEKYYDTNGEYPGCPAMTAVASSVVTTLPGLNPKVLVAPQAGATATNSINFCTDITTSTPGDNFAYVGDGSSVCSTGNSCLQFKLEYKQEATGTIASINSRRTASLLTSNDITDLAATSAGFDQMNLSMTAISGAATYNVQWNANTNSFTSPTGSGSYTTNAPLVTGLSVGTLYYFRAQPVSLSNVPGNWSNIASATTDPLDAPVCTAAPVPTAPTSQLQCSWTPITHAASYTLEYANDDTFTGATTVTTAANPYKITGLPVGTTRSFHVKSVNGPFSSAWSAPAHATTIVPPPSTPTFTYSNNNGSTTTPAVTCTLGSPRYSRETTYRTDGSTAEAYGAYSAWQSATTFGDFITGEGMFGIAKVQAECLYNGFESAGVESAAVSEIRPITSFSTSTAVVQTTSPGLIQVYGSCPSGTTAQYLYGQIYHGSAGTHSGGGWGAGSGFNVTNGTPNWSYNDGLNVYRVSRLICDTPYWERGYYSGVPGSTLTGSGLTAYNNFVGAGYSYSVAR